MNARLSGLFLLFLCLNVAQAEAQIFINFDPDMNGGALIEGDSHLKNYHDWTVVETVALSFVDSQKKGPQCKLTISKKKRLDTNSLLLLKRSNQHQSISFVAEFVAKERLQNNTLVHPYARFEAYRWNLKRVESKNLSTQAGTEILIFEPDQESTFKMTTWEFDGINYMISGHELLDCFMLRNPSSN